MTAQIRHIRAGAPAPVDQRKDCRHEYDAGEYLRDAADESERIALWKRRQDWPAHTSSPAEREFARYDRDPKARAWFWRVVGLSIAAAVAVYLITR